MLNLIQDLTVGDFGGYQQVLAVHAEGSLEAEKLAIFRSYDPRPAISVRAEAGRLGVRASPLWAWDRPKMSKLSDCVCRLRWHTRS